ncbi:RsmB/NOP family class I SAM-dependent RNA methyltransferase [Oecophyllibacter saccharovorans]|uniref:RsmB/NOP family class I SAM-dependent RNA methyltransferase n=1 Tax=Oecophyllibacter saccharovorans TaxID=2558360 RepID=A0A506UR15_9PROT|nr:RsmB/NOP family class I SAM-dependent RNA methyltransferase [Oecophyllibacter saccharovorans]QDH15762.1 RsmB/NOP family class I SAM-dependent RNA methyltransferase [Oecophyllibacter saccharovorans]TPW35543.1 RsmB/NOP family class I SAM-dependent RNA methyltransferase [Oecophyllibacter saccharovorans]TPW36782.1 RsmB/NOP family class I SAM-dependent RNA methyltransferase [Oecophyllibacter saccharovorans]
MTPEARLSAAIELVCAIQSAPRRPADATANAFFRERRFIGGGDRRAISSLVWDVLRAWRRLHWHLRAAPEARGHDISPRLLCAAMLFFSGTPLAQVQALFSGERYAPSRLTERERLMLDELQGHTLTEAKQSQAVQLEYPDWLTPYLEQSFGDQVAPEMEAMLTQPSLDLRVNLLRGTRSEALRELRREGFEVEETELSPWGLRMGGRQPVTSSPVFQEGLVEIQDEGSQLVAAATDPKPGERLLDYCAGAAGKTLALAMLMENRGQITACDVSQVRLEGAVKRLRRADVHNVSRHLLVEGDKWAKRRAGSFDTVLVDAPCSGTGTWRRNPDARLRLTEQDIEELVPKQAEILATAARMVRPGGKLVYATCSLLDVENSLQLKNFLKAHPEFSLVSPQEASKLLPPKLQGQGSFSLTPRSDGTDGFFVGVMKRREEA